MNNYSFVADLVDKLINNQNRDQNPITVLDLGCGDCQLLAELRARYASEQLTLYGVDIYIDKERLQRVRSQNKSISIYDIMPYDDLSSIGDSFDAIVCNQVLEHVDDAQRLIDIASRKIKRNGFFIAGYPTSEIIIEPHLFIPFVHRFSGRLPRKIAINIKFIIAKTLNIGRTSRLKWSERENYIKNRIDYMQEDLFYRSKRDYDSMLRSVGSPIDVSYAYIDSSRSSLAMNIIKSTLSLIPSKRLKNKISQSIFGVYTITQKL
jgi:SAM-dependent methyltransferase